MRKLFTLLLAYAERDLQPTYRLGVPSPSVPYHSPTAQSTAARLLLCARRAGGRLLHDRRSAAAAPQHSAQQKMRAVRVKVTAEHKLVNIGSAVYKKAATFVCHVVNKCTRAFGTQLFVK